MKKQHYSAISFITLLVLTACQQKKTVFQSLPASETGIHFSNRITENDTFNILSYEYVYNGGGVGIGDFNNDGLQDVFFTGNMAGNQLYLNKGNFKFEDVTETAGIAAKNRWNSGVAVVDINNDGWLDLYVCATTYQPSSRRANSLFVNNGNSKSGVSFTEMATEYGIADTSHTMNAAFFDYDNDGDLDLYLLVNQMDENHVPNIYRPKITDGSSKRTDKLFRNDFDEKLGHPVYTDVSKEMGITIEGFGLGVNICDINQDGWKDIYVTNDYLTNDLLWLNVPDTSNQQSGVVKRKFVDVASKYLKHTSHSAMGNDVVDFNNDGLPDIVAVDMLPEDNLRRKTMLMPNNYNSYLNNDKYGYQYQYVRNTLQINQGNRPNGNNPLFSEVSMFAGISSTDWSWTPLAADFDNDGDRDLIVTNGFPKDVTDRDFIDYNSEKGNYLTKQQLLEAIPSVKIRNYAFRNSSSNQSHYPNYQNQVPIFESVGEAWGITQPSFSNGAAYADLDNDGDLDYIVNNINDSAFVFKNKLVDMQTDSANWLNIKFKGTEKNRNGLGAIVEVFYQGKKQIWDNTPYRGYLSSVETGAHFGLGSTTSLDSVVVIWQEGKQQVWRNVPTKQTLTVEIQNALPYSPQNIATTQFPNFQEITASLGINFTPPESDYIDFNVQRLLPHKLSQFGPAIAVGDVNGDGLDDFYVSGSHFNKGKFFVQTPAGQFVEQDLLPGPNGDDKVQEELGTLLFDADGDGDLDLYLATGGYEFDISDTCYQDLLFLNKNGHFSLAKNALPSLLSSGSCAKAADFDRDGDLDIFVGGRVLPFQYPMPVSSYLLRNDGKGHFTIANKDAAPGLENIGLVCDALWTDYDNDGWQDLLVAGEWMPLTFFKNQNGKLVAQSPITNHQSPATGWWNSLVAADFDLDGDMDYIAGNLGTNTLLKADEEHPIGIYAADFDANKTEMTNPAADANVGGNMGLDAIPSAWFPDVNGKLTEYPFFGRADMDKQLVKMKKLYLHHSEFGKANMTTVMKHFPDSKPLVLKANYLKTSYLENMGGGKFALHELPTAVQLAPIFGMVTGDFNGDNLPDVLLSGNDFGAETGMGRYDAFNGLLLLGDGKGNFTPTSMQQSGVCIAGDGKSLARFQGADGSMLIAAGQNKGPLMVIKNENSGVQAVKLQPMDCAAVITLADGRAYREELPYGSSFLSQSARRLWLPVAATACELIDYQGKKRKVEIGKSERMPQ
ncbi:MAG: RNA-binding protein [Bacteroidetes bacterium]|nr:RNA-binding protein [Bacteroidota bacterium]